MLSLPILAIALAVVGIDRFAPAPRGSDWFVLDSLDLGTSAGLVTTWAVRPLVGYSDAGMARVSIVSTQVVAHLGGALTFADRVRVALDLPAAVYQHGTAASLEGAEYPAPATAALGDARAAVDVRVLAHLAVGAGLLVPTGADYAGRGSVRAEVHAAVAGDAGPVAYAARAAAGSDVELGAAAGLRALDRKLLVGVEASAVVEHHPPIELLLGLHYVAAPGIVVGAGAGPGIGHAAGTPAARVIFSVEWRR